MTKVCIFKFQIYVITLLTTCSLINSQLINKDIKQELQQNKNMMNIDLNIPKDGASSKSPIMESQLLIAPINDATNDSVNLNSTVDDQGRAVVALNTTLGNQTNALNFNTTLVNTTNLGIDRIDINKSPNEIISGNSLPALNSSTNFEDGKLKNVSGSLTGPDGKQIIDTNVVIATTGIPNIEVNGTFNDHLNSSFKIDRFNASGEDDMFMSAEVDAYDKNKSTNQKELDLHMTDKQLRKHNKSQKPNTANMQTEMEGKETNADKEQQENKEERMETDKNNKEKSNRNNVKENSEKNNQETRNEYEEFDEDDVNANENENSQSNVDFKREDNQQKSQKTFGGEGELMENEEDVDSFDKADNRNKNFEIKKSNSKDFKTKNRKNKFETKESNIQETDGNQKMNFESKQTKEKAFSQAIEEMLDISVHGEPIVSMKFSRNRPKDFE